MFSAIPQLPVACPHCGFIQNEPAAVISTYCRACSQHFTVRKASIARAVVLSRFFRFEAPPTRMRTLSSTFLCNPFPKRQIRCLECFRFQWVNALASAIHCPACSAFLPLRDISIHHYSTQAIKTCGNLQIHRKGTLNATYVLCTNALIVGKFTGSICCTETLELQGCLAWPVQIWAKQLIVYRNAVLYSAQPIQVQHATIAGQVNAPLICQGTVHIKRLGTLQGSVHAQALCIEEGGQYSGMMVISSVPGSS